MHFIDCLNQALEGQIDNTEAREILLLKLSVENVNADYKKLLKSLPIENPTLVQTIEACNRISTVEHEYVTMAAAFAAMRGLPGTSEVCFGCGKPRHFKETVLL